jgi:sulfotransferase family protein
MRVLIDSNTRSPADFIHLFAVIGAQRTGTNLLREILNTNERIAMLGEVLMPSPALAHWDNFCRNLPIRSVMPMTRGEAESLLDRYFKFVEYRIRNHWEGNKKSCIYTFGVDIKYNQLNHIAPADWDSTSSSPFILRYLQSRGVTLIHTTRNVIHSAISTLIASRRNLWHNYDGAVIQHGYYIDVEECLAQARTILQQRTLFLKTTSDCKIVNCRYESLMNDIKRSGSQLEIPEGPGPLRDIAAALGVPFRFRYDRRLQKAINIPYSSLLANYDAFIRRLRDSEFSRLVSTLE